MFLYYLVKENSPGWLPFLLCLGIQNVGYDLVNTGQERKKRPSDITSADGEQSHIQKGLDV